MKIAVGIGLGLLFLAVLFWLDRQAPHVEAEPDDELLEKLEHEDE